MYRIRFTNKFKKDVKRCKKRGFNLSELEHAIDILQSNGKLPPNVKLMFCPDSMPVCGNVI